MTLTSRSASRVMSDFHVSPATPAAPYTLKNHPHVGVKILAFACFVVSILGLISYSWSHRFLVEAGRVQAGSPALDSTASQQIADLQSQQSWQAQIFPWQAQEYSTSVASITTQNSARAESLLQSAIVAAEQSIATLRTHSSNITDVFPTSQATLPDTLRGLEATLALSTTPQEAQKIKETVQKLTVTLDGEADLIRKTQFVASISAQFASKKPDIELLFANESADFQSFVEYFNQVRDGITSPTLTPTKTLTQLKKENDELAQPLLARVTLMANDERARITEIAAEKARIDAEQQQALEEAALKQKLAAEKKAAIPPPAPLVAKSLAIDLSDQMMYAYENGVLVKSSPITSGKDSTPTVTGTFQIYQKLADTYLQGADYRLHVNYWMPFYDGYGIHDAYWRHIFGGEDYHNRGSHGCLNTPDDMVAWVWNWAPVGTTVMVQA
jgi:hypothetical protein